MHADADDLPLVGERRSMLGVRPPGGPGNPDVSIDPNGLVVMNGHGMSVFRGNDLAELRPELVPPHLRKDDPSARGPKNLHIFSLGTGEFQSGQIADRLQLIATPQRVHGSIVPDGPVLLKDFQAALAATRLNWRIDEP